MNNSLLRQLYEKYYKEIYLYLFSLCKSQEIAEDLVQETFLKALLSLTDNHTNMRAWLYMVSRNLYFNYAKKESRKVSLDEDETTALEGMVTAGVLEKLLQDERKKILYKGLLKLDEKKREVLLLQYFGGLSQREIAAVLKLTAENVRILAYRGKKELRLYMEANGYDIS